MPHTTQRMSLRIKVSKCLEKKVAKVDSERQVFSKFFIPILPRGSRRRNIFFHIFGDVSPWDLNHGLTSNNPTHYLPVLEDFMTDFL